MNTNIITKTCKGSKFIYTLNGEVVRTSKRDYKYACIATARHNGKVYLASLGNDADSTLKSMASKFKEWCDMEVITLK